MQMLKALRLVPAASLSLRLETSRNQVSAHVAFNVESPVLTLGPRLSHLRSLCLLALGSCRGMETLWLLLRHPMMGEGGSAAPRGVSPSVSSMREEVEPPMMLLSLVEGT